MGALIKKYDKDRKLNQDEVNQIGRPLVLVDANKDGFITEAEIIDYSLNK